ncbi:RNA-binding protein NOB1 [Dermacentor andersoni]|uniref:RNA-binding protein NOB1 n=1 Tax=Dermacentor andersoni TaxID=34620 RepID=UPI002155431D|nr:RNA-binding protein NOB1-like [Dermacentor andersoni]
MLEMDPVELLSSSRVKNLVVDSGGFIKNAALQEIGENIYTVAEVVSEIKDKATKQRLQVLPYKLNYRVPSPEAVKIMTDFSKLTGDYPSLSAVDIKVLALTYMLEKEHVGTSHLSKKPKSIEVQTTAAPRDVVSSPGFFGSQAIVGAEKSEPMEPAGSLDGCNKEDCSEDEVDSTEEDSSDGEWITPSNIAEIKKEMGSLTLEEVPIPVACISTDFAVQNVLIQMGLKAVSVDGMAIRHARTFVLRCHACFTITKVMTKQFCPACGNKTLKRVSVAVAEDGSTKLYINYKRPINIRGTRYSLPTPKGGKHSTDPILCEDQPIPQNRLSKMAMGRVDVLDADYLTRNSPFKINDVYSRSAHLSMRAGSQGSRNPNQVKRNTGNHKKRRN